MKSCSQNSGISTGGGATLTGHTPENAAGWLEQGLSRRESGLLRSEFQLASFLESTVAYANGYLVGGASHA